MNIIKAILLFFVGLFSIPPKLNAQNFNPKDYTSFHKQIVFEDNFDNDKNKWIDKDDTTDDGKIDTAFVESKETKIANGYLKHDNRSRSKIYAAGIETNIDFNKNFEMEISALIFFSFKSNHPSAITFWGRDSAYDCNYFYYDEDNYFIFTDCKIQSDCKSKSKHGNAFIKNDFNKIVN